MDGEFYYKGDIAYDRITKITDYFAPPELVEWKVKVGKKEANRISRIALKFGKEVDDRIRANPLSPVAKKKEKAEVVNAIAAWNSWLLHYQPLEIRFPETLYDEDRKIAGTPDFEWLDREGVWTLTDIKTSREIRPANFFQLGGYGSMRIPKPGHLAILDLSKALGMFDYISNEKLGLSVDACINGFNEVYLHYRIYHYLQSRLKPNRAWPEGEAA